MKYKRILLKLSGESLMGAQGHGIDTVRLNEYATQIKEISSLGVQIAIVIGGGNIFRGFIASLKICSALSIQKDSVLFLENNKSIVFSL